MKKTDWTEHHLIENRTGLLLSEEDYLCAFHRFDSGIIDIFYLKRNVGKV